MHIRWSPSVVLSENKNISFFWIGWSVSFLTETPDFSLPALIPSSKGMQGRINRFQICPGKKGGEITMTIRFLSTPMIVYL